MGYTTIFEGKFELNKPLDDETYKLLMGLASTRRVKRDPRILEELGLGSAESFGVEGEFFVEGTWDNLFRTSIINFNEPPSTQPGLWLQWIPTDERKSIVWDGNEKFYKASQWIVYLVESILNPRGYVLEGIVNAQGESDDDKWHIQVENNNVISRKGFHHLIPKPMSYDEWEKIHYGEWMESVLG